MILNSIVHPIVVATLYISERWLLSCAQRWNFIDSLAEVSTLWMIFGLLLVLQAFDCAETVNSIFAIRYFMNIFIHQRKTGSRKT